MPATRYWAVDRAPFGDGSETARQKYSKQSTESLLNQARNMQNCKMTPCSFVNETIRLTRLQTICRFPDTAIHLAPQGEVFFFHGSRAVRKMELSSPSPVACLLPMKETLVVVTRNRAKPCASMRERSAAWHGVLSPTLRRCRTSICQTHRRMGVNQHMAPM